MDSVIDFSKLAAEVKSLNDSLGWVGLKLSAATFAVVIGLLIEYTEDIREGAAALWKDIGESIRDRRIRYCNLSSLDAKVKRTLLGGLLVTGGVALELVYEWKASVIEGKLETDNGKIVAFLDSRARSAELATAKADLAHLELQRRILSKFGQRELTPIQSLDRSS